MSNEPKPIPRIVAKITGTPYGCGAEVVKQHVDQLLPRVIEDRGIAGARAFLMGVVGSAAASIASITTPADAIRILQTTAEALAAMPTVAVPETH